MPENKKAFENFHSKFGDSALENMMIALTHADQLKPSNPDVSDIEFFKKKFQAKLDDIEKHLKTFLSPNLATTLKSRAFPTATARTLELPICKDWRDYFWRGCIKAAGKEKALQCNVDDDMLLGLGIVAAIGFLFLRNLL